MKMGMLGKVLARINAAAIENDSENATYRNRLVLLAAFWLTACLGMNYFSEPKPDIPALAVGHLISLIATVMLRVWFVMRPQRNDFRLVISILIDCYTASIAVAFGGGAGVPFVFAYLWASFGNGFRFGVSMLRYGAVIGFVSFCLVAMITPYWQSKPEIALMVMTILLILPAYASGLISRLEQAIEGAQAASVAKSKFLAMMSHELRTPLNSVINLSLMLPKSGELNDDQKAMAHSINESGEALLEMVDNILIVSRAEEKVNECSLDRMDLYDLLKIIELGLRPLAFQKGLQLLLNIDPALSQYIESNSSHLKKILLNLGGNAIKFTEEGAVLISATKIIDNEQKWLRLSVKDNGPGIPAERQAAIFERFTQLEKGRNNKLGGVGLGLAICADLAKLLKGKIGVESQEGSGAMFTVDIPLSELGNGMVRESLQAPVFVYGSGDSLPVEKVIHTLGAVCNRVGDDVEPAQFNERLRSDAALVFVQGNRRKDLMSFRGDENAYQKSFFVEVLNEGEVASANPNFLFSISKGDASAIEKVFSYARCYESHDDEESSLPSLSVLIVDDKDTNLEVARRMLSNRGHEVHIAHNGEEALDFIAGDTTVDLVLMDVNMPVLDGIEATKLLRMGEAGGARCRVFGLTADITEDGIQDCLIAGMDGVIHKPLRMQELNNLLEEAARMVPQNRNIAAKKQSLVLDLQRLAELQDMDPSGAFVADLAVTFFRDAKEIVETARKAVDDHDITQLQKMRHAMRSTAVSIGANKIDRMCEKARAMDATDIEQMGDKFIDEMVSCLREVQQELTRQNITEISEVVVANIEASAKRRA